MKTFITVLLISILTGCTVNQQPVIFLNSHSSDYLYKIEDAGRNVYYTNDFKQVSATCIVFTAQDSTLKKVCGIHTITSLKY